jgi:hypothetical protein
MLFWPTVSVLGFVVLAALVIALGASSTARYEFERNRVQGQRQQAAVPAAAPAEPVPAGAPGRPGGDHPAADSATQDMRQEQGAAVGLATHPAGKRAVERGEQPEWWLVGSRDDQPGGQIVAGPFPDRIEAEWAALSDGGAASARALYGVQRADGGLVRRQLPADRAWMRDLGDQLDRLPEDWDELLSDDDALGTLVVEVTAALVEAGLPVHDCAGDGPAGGLCLTPEAGRRGVVVSWHQHDRMCRDQVRGAEAAAAVQLTMNAAIAECLGRLGFEVEPVGSTGCSLVVAAHTGW